MPRAKRGFKRRRAVNKVLDRAEGFHLRRKNTFRRASEAVDNSCKQAYKDRRRRKRDFRSLWIVRINAAVAANGMSYSRFMAALKKSNLDLNRKVLAEMALTNPASFGALVDQVRSAAPQH